MPPTDKYVSFEGMVWPNPATVGEVEYQLRYNTVTREEALVAASVIAAYRQLFALSARARNQRMAAILIASARPPLAAPKSTDVDSCGANVDFEKGPAGVPE